MLPTLKYKRLHGDMMEVFEIVHDFYHLEPALKLNFNTFSTIRRNKYKLQKSLCHYNMRKYLFSSTVVNMWNSLPNDVVEVDTIRGGSRNFGKGGGGKGAKPRTERRRHERRRGASPESFEKLDAIFCNLAYIFGIRMASDIIQNVAFAEQKTVAATISIHTHTHTPPHFQKLGFRPL